LLFAGENTVCQAKTDLTNQQKMRKKRESASTADALTQKALPQSKKTPDNAGVFFCPVKKAAAGQFVFKDSP